MILLPETVDVIKEMIKKEHEEIVAKHHPYAIAQQKDGFYRTYVKDNLKKSGRRLIKKKNRADVIEELFKIYEPQEYQKEELHDEATLRKLYPRWKEHKRLHTTAETYMMRIESDWKTYYEKDPIVDVPIVKLTKLMLDEWAHKLIKDNDMTKNCYYNVTVIIRQALVYAVDLGIIETSPFAAVKIDGKRLFRKVKKKADSTQVYSKEEARAIIEMAWDDFHNKVKIYELAPLAVIFQLQTGMRIGEICAAQFGDVEQDYFHVQRMLRRDLKEVVEHPKTECGDRNVYLTQTAKEVISAARNRLEELGINHEYIFSIQPGQPLPERPIADLYEKYCRKLGVECKSSHKARKTVISAWVDNNVNINTARQMAGHASERTTLKNYVYDRSSEDEKHAVLESAVSY